MSAHVRCDGCKEELAFHGRPVAVQGAAVQPGRLPLRAGQRFDWCADCAEAAFKAVIELNKGAAK